MKRFFAQPLITEKSMAKAAEGTYQFVVPTWATKSQVTNFVKQHFSVTVADITTSTLRGDAIRFRHRPGTQATYKKATVRITKGQTIADFSLPVETTEEKTPADKEAAKAEQPTESTITVRSKSKKVAKEEK